MDVIFHASGLWDGSRNTVGVGLFPDTTAKLSIVGGCTEPDKDAVPVVPWGVIPISAWSAMTCTLVFCDWSVAPCEEELLGSLNIVLEIFVVFVLRYGTAMSDVPIAVEDVALVFQFEEKFKLANICH